MSKSKKSSKKSRGVPPQNQKEGTSSAVGTRSGITRSEAPEKDKYWILLACLTIILMFIGGFALPLRTLDQIDAKAITNLYQTSVDTCIKARIEAPYSTIKETKGEKVTVDAAYVSEAQSICNNNTLQQISRAVTLGLFAVGAFLLVNTKSLFETFRLRIQQKNNAEMVDFLDKIELIGLICSICLFMTGIYSFYSMVTGKPAEGAAWIIMASGTLFAIYGAVIITGIVCAAFSRSYAQVSP